MSDEEVIRRQLVRWLAEREKLRSRLTELTELIQEVESWLHQKVK